MKRPLSQSGRDTLLAILMGGLFIGSLVIAWRLSQWKVAAGLALTDPQPIKGTKLTMCWPKEWHRFDPPGAIRLAGGTVRTLSAFGEFKPNRAPVRVGLFNYNQRLDLETEAYASMIGRHYALLLSGIGPAQAFQNRIPIQVQLLDQEQSRLANRAATTLEQVILAGGRPFCWQQIRHAKGNPFQSIALIYISFRPLGQRDRELLDRIAESIRPDSI